MYFLSLCFFLPIINAIMTVKIHRQSFYQANSSCAFLRNTSLSNDASMQSCIWECDSEDDCQTAVYFHDTKICLTFAEVCTRGSIEPSGTVRASVICYRKNQEPAIACPSTSTSALDVTTSIMETSTLTTSMTTIAVTLPPTYIFWSFDSNYNDLYNVYNGVGINNASFISPGYTGYGSALSLNASKSQYVLVSKYINMTYTSFTWEMWVYPTSLVNYDNVMVGMCESTNTDKCLHLLIRNTSLYFAFWGDDCISSTTVNTNQWHHFGFVYNYTTSTQYIYLNGDLVCVHNSVGPFLGSSAVVTIGAINSSVSGSAPVSYWTGYIDQVSYVSRAKTEIEILTDATLVAYYSFDNGSFDDSGSNKINGTGVNISSTIGRVNQSILFNASEAYFQANNFTLLGASYRSYSIALWIYKLSSPIGNGTIVLLSDAANGLGWCVPIIGLSSSYQIVGQTWNGTAMVYALGPILPFSVWTHVVSSYSITNGVRLWVNGALVNSTGPFTYAPPGVPNAIKLGSSLDVTSTCAGGPVVKGQFYGMMDEFRVYSRELNASDVYALANP